MRESHVFLKPKNIPKDLGRRTLATKQKQKLKIVVDKNVHERNRKTDLLKLGDAFFLNFANYKLDSSSEDDLGGWGVSAREPLGSHDVEGDILRAISYDTSSLSKRDAQEAKTYAVLLYKDFGEFLTGVWAEYRRLIK